MISVNRLNLVFYSVIHRNQRHHASPNDTGRAIVRGVTMDLYEFTLMRYDDTGLVIDMVVCARKDEIQHFLDDGWRVVIIKPTGTTSRTLTTSSSRW